MIHVRDLNKHFKNKTVFQSLSFDIHEGETIAIIGPSGSGKSTLVRCLNLLETPNSGSILIDDIAVSFPHPSKEIIRKVRGCTGMVFQSFNLFPHFTALENVMVGLTSVKKIKKNIAEAIAIQNLQKVGLLDHISKYPSQLSGGQQQRVAIARSLALAPKILLMDEPTSALDPELVQEVLSVIKSITHEGMTLVIVTHELNFARDIADRVMFIDAGDIVEFEPAETFFKAPKMERTRKFLRSILPTTDYVI